MNPIVISNSSCHSSKNSPVRVVALAAGAALLLIAGTATSCSTAAGFGRDVEKGGNKIQEAATN